MKALFEFIKTNFNRMPGPVQVFVYLLFVAVFVFELIKPSVITARVVMKDADGSESHYRGQPVMVDYAGHTMKFRTNGDGLLVIPAPITSINVRIDLAAFLDVQDREAWQGVHIRFDDFWFRDVVKIVLSEKEPKIAVESRFAVAESAVFRLGRFAQIQFAKHAHAGMLGKSPSSRFPGELLPSGATSPPWKKHTGTKTQEVRRSIEEIISKRMGIPRSAITEKFKLQKNPNLNFRKRVKIVSAVEKQFGFKIPDEHWTNIKNVGELTTYVLDRQKIYQQYNVEKNRNWYQYLQQIPKQERPVYRRY